MNRAGELKPSLSALPLRALMETSRTMVFGADKHGAQDWLKREPRLFFDAMVRHGVARELGELRDPETGLLHSAHMAANALIIVEHDLIRLEAPGGTGEQCSSATHSEDRSNHGTDH